MKLDLFLLWNQTSDMSTGKQLLTQENSTIYAPDNFFQGGVWKSCFPFYTRAPFQHEFKVFHEQIRERASSDDSFRLDMVTLGL